MEQPTIQSQKKELSILNSNNTFGLLERVNQQIENIDVKYLTYETGKALLELRQHLNKAIILSDKIEQAF